MKREITCQCGCKGATTVNRLREITVEYHEESADGTDRVRKGRRFWVLPACEAPFRIELELMSTLRTLALLMADVPWWRRLSCARSIYSAKFRHDRRLKPKTARRDAWRTMLVTVSPDWLAERLTKRWKRLEPAVPAITP